MTESVVEGKLLGLPALKLSGKIVESRSRKATEKLDALAKKNAIVIVDVSEVEVMDSRGIGSLMYNYTLMQRTNRSLIVYNANASPATYMRQLFEQTHLDNVLTIATSTPRLKAIVEQLESEPGR